MELAEIWPMTGKIVWPSQPHIPAGVMQTPPWQLLWMQEPAAAHPFATG